jgi:hypothetical protein
MIEFVLGLFFWVCMQAGIDPDSIKKPVVKTLNPAQMATLYCGKPQYCEELKPVYFDGKILYLMEGVEWEKDRVMTSFIVHDLVHYVQVQKIKDKKKLKKYVEPLELQALAVQKLYISLIEI